MPSDTELQWLIDRMKIRDCLGRYTRGLDRHDAALITSAFWPEARISYRGRFDEGSVEEFAAWSNQSHSERWSQHSHNVTNQNVEFDADRGGADVESYILFFHRSLEERVEIGIGRYIDRFVRRGEEWRIVAREFVVDMIAKADPMVFTNSRFPMGVSGDQDLSYVRPYGGNV